MDRSQHAVTAELEAGPDVDAEELAELSGRLRDALLELDVEAVEPASDGAAPEGAKGVELLAIGGLVIRFVMSPTMLKSVVDVAAGWLSRQQARSVKLTLDGDTLEITGTSSEEQQRLTELWVARHAGDG
jgi:hypothetical protein